MIVVVLVKVVVVVVIVVVVAISKLPSALSAYTETYIMYCVSNQINANQINAMQSAWQHTFGWMLECAVYDSLKQIGLEQKVLETGCVDTDVVASLVVVVVVVVVAALVLVVVVDDDDDGVVVVEMLHTSLCPFQLLQQPRYRPPRSQQSPRLPLY